MFIDLVNKRQSVRKYTSRPVEKEKLEKVIEAARLSPSACNSQPWHIIVVDDPELKNKVAKETYSEVVRFNRFAMSAPMLLVIVLEKPKLITQVGGRLKNKEYPLFDIGILAEHICLQAAELDLGSCMMGWFNEKKIMKLLSVPASKSIGLVISLGYPPEGYPQRKKIRKKPKEIISYNLYQK